MTKRKETVTKVIDKNTPQTNSHKHSVRLANVDAPEKGSRGAKTATQALNNLIKGQKVEVDTVARDVYGRSVAKVKVNGKSVNNAMNKKMKK